MTSEVLSTETKFTSGTWHASKTFRESGYAPGIDLGSSNGTNLGLVHYDARDQEPREVRANANLFAASKDLYEALDSLLNCVDGVHDVEQLERCKDRALKAITRARGGSSNEGE